VELTVAKTAAAIAERATLDDDPVPARFIELKTTSPSIITGSTPYSQSIRVPGRLISAEDDAIGGNSVIRLTYRGFYSADLGYALRAVVVCALTAL
jgi:Iap family predicted aminopeptidase